MEVIGPHYIGPAVAQVCRRDDPLKIGRVKVLCPAVFGERESFWALPIGGPGGGGVKKTDETYEPRGLFAVPRIGANVALFFHLGDSTELFYMGGWFHEDGGSKAPASGLAGTLAGDPDVTIWEFNDWKLIVSDKAGVARFRIESKTDPDTFYDIDPESGLMTARMSAKIRFEAKGSPDSFIELDGASGKIVASTPALELGAAGATEAAVLGSAMLTLFNAHTHNDPISGVTGVPNTSMVAGTHTSAKVTLI